MTRLQKKCMVLSLAFHGLLMATVIATAAFHSEPPVSELPLLHFIDLPLRDAPGVGGERVAAPRPAPTAPAPALPQTRPQPSSRAAVSEPRRQTEPSKTIAKISPKQSETKPVNTKPVSEPTSGHHITVDLTPIHPGKVSPKHPAVTSDSENTAQEERTKRLQEIQNAFSALNSSVDSKEPSSKVVPLPGLDGGEAFINYRTFIFNRYYQAWKTPEEAAGRNPVADAKIVVSRSGDIVSSEIVSKSGDESLDRSVERALDSVKQLPPFPPGATDAQRIFILRFDLSAKQPEG